MDGIGVSLNYGALSASHLVATFLVFYNPRMGTAPSGTPHILIVDDEPAIRTILRRILKGKCQVTLAERGQEALAQLTSNPQQFDLMIPPSRT
jgi:PleD family two-component response regulator